MNGFFVSTEMKTTCFSHNGDEQAGFKCTGQFCISSGILDEK